MDIIKEIKLWLSRLKPRIYNLPQVYRIVWMGYEWIIPKF